ncbi:recombinase family protein [Leifsonia sp. AG29]|uniref:recombinase family protein n=1 Tax=Leifsonia sp. AG29 TaxID=2598860 RepID=UPI00131A984D|nr:recombinase family protein [Leifsonia sp. AG29]
MSTPARRRAVLYCRISRTTEESVSLERQRRDLEKLCELEGWDVVDVITDDGKSGTKERAEATRALDMLRSGAADTLLVWAFDRWSRQGLRAVADLIEVMRERKTALFYAKKDGLRSDQPAWRIIASVLAEVAAMEAENTSARILAARAAHLSKTAPEDQRFLGGRAPFGYRPVPNPHGPGKALAIDEYEAHIVREVAERVIAGETLTKATLWLDAEGVPTPQSPARRARQAGAPMDGLDRGAWRVTTVRNLWRSDTLIGRTTQKQAIRGTDGQPVLGADGRPKFETRTVVDEAGLPIQRWEPILDFDTYAQLQARLPRVGRVQPRRTVSWLTNVARCAGCGGKLYAQKRSRNGQDELFFRCAQKGYVLAPCVAPATVRVDRLEEYVEAAFLRAAGSHPELERIERVIAPDVAQQLRDVSMAIQDVTTAMGRDGADGMSLLRQLDELKARRTALRELSSTTEIELRPTGRTLAEVWAELGDDLDSRRDHLRQVITGVVVERSVRNGTRAPLDGERVRLMWNADHGFEVDYDDAEAV